MQTARGFVIAATGLAAEAKLAASGPQVVSVAGGANEDRLKALIEQALGEGARGIISFGIAGGLDPALPSGTPVIGTEVHDGEKCYQADARWTRKLQCLRLRIAEVRSGPVAGCSKVIDDPFDKRDMWEDTGAIAADMESHVVARIASERRLPFAVLRVIADSADQSLPPAAVLGLKPDGTPDLAAVLKSLARQPGQLPDLLRAAFAARRAMNGLLRCHRLVGPRLGFVDLG